MNIARNGFPFNDDDSFLRNVGGLTVNSLNHILQMNKFNESLPHGELEIIKHSPYFTDEEFNKQNKKQAEYFCSVESKLSKP